MKFLQGIHRALVLFQLLLSSLLLFLPITVLVVYLSVWGEVSFGASVRTACPVSNGIIISPPMVGKVADTTTKPSSQMGFRCSDRIERALTHGDHLVPCFLNESNDNLTISRPELLRWLFWLLAALILPILGLPTIVTLLSCLLSSKSVPEFRANLRQSATYNRQGRRAVVIGTPALFFSMIFGPFVAEDMSLALSYDWTSATCTVREICASDGNEDSSGLVFERKSEDGVYRSNRLDGYRARSLPSELSHLTVGDSFQCYYDPTAPAHMRAIPYSPPDPIEYLSWLAMIVLLVLGIHHLWNWSTNRATRQS